MLKGLAAGLVALALVATPSAAAPVSGWYAGIYAGSAHAGDIDLGVDVLGGLFDGPGVIETPTSFVNDGVDPDFFDTLNLVLEDYPFADFGMAASYMLDGQLELLDTLSIGAVVGYGFGNGVRVETDLSALTLQSGDYTVTGQLYQEADGSIDGAGVWTWTNAFEMVLPLPVPATFELPDYGMDYRLDAQFLLVNAFYDFDTGTAFSPYLGGGAGVAVLTSTLTEVCGCIDSATTTSINFAPAAQLGGGVRIALSDPVGLDFGYRLKVAAPQGAFSTGEIFDTGVGFFDALVATQSGLIGVHTVQAGLTVALP